ncbi:MAG: YicC family protein [Bacteroidales bacterium]|nr:YicC family protein [Candidatus Sodaliphilus aphodohippi]
MILSMTGFGKAVKIFNNRKITVEVKSLNSKQADISVRIPTVYRSIELEMRSFIISSLQRGKIDLLVTCEDTDCSGTHNFNLPIIKQYKQQIEDCSRELDIPLPQDWYSTLLRLPDVMNNSNTIEELSEDEKSAVMDTLKQAVEALNQFRTQEGYRLEEFFTEKVDAIQQLLNEVPNYETKRVDKIKARIMDSLSKLDGVDYDNNRLEQELIYYIEKLDITEEKIRLQNHINYFRETMAIGNGQGKKLGFITQEMGREINTTGSKANQAELQNLVVKMKDHLEQIKEQVLNVL